MTYRDLSQICGINLGRVHRAIAGDRLAKPSDIRRLRTIMGDRSRLRRSSDPAFLAAVRRIAVPFFAARLQP